ncbi:lipid-A-disaccharide synthase [Candidatus Berkiella cookevillensis]|uniref:Lipid-A-disaccharide synthase n=1 Tax=Candidatus Berkiella cookevillensis TaxID=437022 RepID=A0A0Q9YHH4_9GAMM|nr:lipid-A-disaccharide synthase [Candidatus Berkiella cookevillensis]MCS5708369.1 lipid-A-disaccharide synthase [Candidatus Berkiella cookevillensis]
MNKQTVIGIVAGEASGDILGQSIMHSLKMRCPSVRFVGVGGPHMQKEGMESIGQIETLSVMGLIEPLKKLPQILRLKKNIISHFKKDPPACFIGIDAPDFNLRLEKILKNKKIKTMHLVSPTIWAWRANRIHDIKKAVDLMLLIFPFEKEIYDRHRVPACYIGHPIADSIEMTSDKFKARAALKLDPDAQWLALMPGSRDAELRYLANDFFLTAKWLKQKVPNLKFIVPCVNEARFNQVKEILQSFPDLQDVHLVLEQSITAMQASDAILLASGTAALQAALIKRPCVVAYRMSGFTYQIAKRLVKAKYMALPNIIADKILMPEFLQDAVQPEAMGKVLLEYIKDPSACEELLTEFQRIHKTLKCDAGDKAAEAILKFISQKSEQK